LLLFVSACGGGGGGGGSVPSGPVATPTPSPVPTATPPSTALFTLTPDSTSSITGSLRRPRYVSPNTSSIAIVVNGAGSATILNLHDPAHCDAAGKCSISLNAPAGNDTFLVSAYDGVNGAGNLLSRATVQATIAPNGSSTVSAVLNGVVASIGLTLANPLPTLHQTTTDALTVVAKDASNATIVGPGGYLYPITLTDSDASGHSSLTKTTLSGPGDSTALQYDGGYAAGTISASAQGVKSAATAQFSPMIPTTETALPSGHTATGIVAGADGALWFVSRPGSIGRITTSGTVTEYAVPGWNPATVCAGPDGAIWIGAQSTQSASFAVIRRNADGSYTTYPAGSGSSIGPLIAGPDGNLWFVAYGSLNEMTTSGVWTQYHLKDANGNPIVALTVARGPDGRLWVGASGALVRYDIGTGTTTLFPVTASLGGTPVPATPGTIVVGPDSRLYFSTTYGIMASDTSGAITTVYPLTSGIIFGALTFTPDGALWFSSGTVSGGNPTWTRVAGNTAVPLEGSTGTSVFPPPPADTMLTGPDGALWYTRGSVIGRMVP
jgi:streptogramin lyase